MLSALYYPFSRCIDGDALKQLLLVFDSVTFIDPVDDEGWRAKLFRDLENAEDSRFRSYRDLERALLELRSEGAVRVQHPDHLAAGSLRETSASALSDLQDPTWCRLASNPAAFGLPHRSLGSGGRATWQIFTPKFPHGLRRALESESSLRQHLVYRGDDYQSWTVSYEAGSAAAISLHLAAAEELTLAPVTDSEMHHRLLLRKLARSLTPETEWLQPSSKTVDSVANQAAMQLIEHLLPKTVLAGISFESILRFRVETKNAREELVQHLKRQLARVASLSSRVEMAAEQTAVVELLRGQVREYQSSLTATRDRLWPGIVKAATSVVTAGSAGAIALQFIAGGPFAVLAGSIAGASLSLLHTALEQHADASKVRREASPAVAYLSHVARLNENRLTPR